MASTHIESATEWLTIRQSANHVGCHQNTIRNLINRGELKASRIGLRLIRISADDLAALLTPVVGGEYSIWNR
jgi:excisionase family DNA binding protein